MQKKAHHIVKANSPKSQNLFYKYIIYELLWFAMGKYNKVTNYLKEFKNDM